MPPTTAQDEKAGREPNARPDEPRVSVDVVGLGVDLVCGQVARQTGVSVVVDTSFASRPCTLRVSDVPVSVALELLGRSVGADISDVNGVYYLGQVAAGDAAVLVVSAPNLPANGRDVVAGVVGGDSQVSVLPGGVLVVVGRARALARVRSFVEQLRGAAPGSFVIQAYVLETSESHLRDLQAAGPNLAFSGSVGRGADFFSVRAWVESQIAAGVDSGNGWSLETPLLCCADGEQAAISRSRTVYVQTSNFTAGGQGVAGSLQAVVVESGFKCRASSVDEQCGRYEVEWRASDLESAELVPRVRSDQFSASVLLPDGVIGYVGQFARSRENQSSRVAVGRALGFSRSGENRILSLWVRGVRVGRSPSQTKTPETVGAVRG
jgi:hypothetical protein